MTIDPREDSTTETAGDPMTLQFDMQEGDRYYGSLDEVKCPQGRLCESFSCLLPLPFSHEGSPKRALLAGSFRRAGGTPLKD